jgi:hypothetical protein
MARQLVTYIRVSTNQQGRSGLGPGRTLHFRPDGSQGAIPSRRAWADVDPFILHPFAALAETNVLPVINEVRRAGATTLREIADAQR